MHQSSASPNLPIVFEEAVKAKIFKNAAIIVSNGAKVEYSKKIGTADFFDLASLTKPYATALLFAAFWSQGRISPDMKVTAILPDFKRFADVTFRQLLTHTSGLAAELPSAVEFRDFTNRAEKVYSESRSRRLSNKAYGSRRRSFARILAETKYEYLIRAIRDKSVIHSGNPLIYSDTGYQLIGRALEVIAGKPLAQAVTDEVYKPLGLETEINFFGIMGKTTPHDFRAARYFPFAVGHAGLFATPQAILKITQAIFNSAYGDQTTASVWKREVAIDLLRVMDKGRGYAFDFTSDHSTIPRGQCYRKAESFGHTGYVGTSIWIEPSALDRLSPRAILFFTDTAIVSDYENSQIKSSFNNVRTALSTWACEKFHPPTYPPLKFLLNPLGNIQENFPTEGG